LLYTAADLGVDLRRCVFIGDSVTDLQAARAAGCQPLMVRTGRQAHQLARLAKSDLQMVLVDDLAMAVAWTNQSLVANLSVCESAAPLHPALYESHRE
jgi:D-glycero-D-manno-heptose 1,7-bisphosphate phosphatase